MRKFFLTATVATMVAASGCGATNQCRRGGCENYYGSTNGEVVCDDGAGYDDGAYADGAVYGGAQYPVYGDGQVVVGPQMIGPGETIGAPMGEPLPGPAQN